MQIGKFREIMDPLKAKVAKLDALVKEGGQHFNEDQAARAYQLTAEVYATAGQAVQEAQQFFSLGQAEDQLETQIDQAEGAPLQVTSLAAITADQWESLKDGDQVQTPDGKVFTVTDTALLRPVSDDEAHTAAMAAPLDENHPITSGAIASMDANGPQTQTITRPNPASTSKADTASLITHGENTLQAVPVGEVGAVIDELNAGEPSDLPSQEGASAGESDGSTSAKSSDTTAMTASSIPASEAADSTSAPDSSSSASPSDDPTPPANPPVSVGVYDGIPPGATVVVHPPEGTEGPIGTVTNAPGEVAGDVTGKVNDLVTT